MQIVMCGLCTHLPSCSMVTPGTPCTQVAWRPALTPPRCEHDHPPSSRTCLPEHHTSQVPLVQINLGVQAVHLLYRPSSRIFFSVDFMCPSSKAGQQNGAHLDLWPSDHEFPYKILNFRCLTILRKKRKRTLQVALLIQPSQPCDTIVAFACRTGVIMLCCTEAPWLMDNCNKEEKSLTSILSSANLSPPLTWKPMVGGVTSANLSSRLSMASWTQG